MKNYLMSAAVATALAIFYLKNGVDKAFIRERVLDAYYPEWSGRTYEEIHDGYVFNSTCPGTVGPAILSFDASEDYVDCIRLAISLGGDADTLSAIAGPMAYAFYREMPDSLVYAALKKLPDWMVTVNERFDKRITEIHAEYFPVSKVIVLALSGIIAAGKVSFLTGDLAHTFRFTARCAHDSPGKIPPLK